MSDVMDKSLEELRAAISEDLEKDPEFEDAPTQSDGDPKVKADASANEGTSEDPSESDPSEDKSEEEKWVVPGKFRTQEDLLKSYGELESFAGKQSSEIQKLRQAVVEPPRKGESPNERTARLKKFADKIQEDPIEAIKEIVRQETGKVETGIKAKEFERVYYERKKNPEFEALEPIMSQIAVQYSDMIQANDLQNDPRLLDILEFAARGVYATELAKKAKAKGVKEGESLHRKKQRARVEGSSGTKKAKKIDTSKLTAAQLKELIQKGELE